MSLGDLYIDGVSMSSPSASGTIPENYWRDQWLAEDPKRTVAQWDAKQERERAASLARRVAERRALADEYRRRVPQMAEWTDDQVQQVIYASYDLLDLDY